MSIKARSEWCVERYALPCVAMEQLDEVVPMTLEPEDDESLWQRTTRSDRVV